MGFWYAVMGIYGGGGAVDTRSVPAPHRATIDDNQLGIVSRNTTATATDRRIGTIAR